MHTYFQTCITTSILIYLYELYTGFFAFQSFHLVSQRPNTQYNLKSLFHVFIVVFFLIFKFCDYFKSVDYSTKKVACKHTSTVEIFNCLWPKDLEHSVTVLLRFFFLSISSYMYILLLKLSIMHILQFRCHTSWSRLRICIVLIIFIEFKVKLVIAFKLLTIYYGHARGIHLKCLKWS